MFWLLEGGGDSIIDSIANMSSKSQYILRNISKKYFKINMVHIIYSSKSGCLPPGLLIHLIYKLNFCRSDRTFDRVVQDLVRNNQRKLHVVQDVPIKMPH